MVSLVAAERQPALLKYIEDRVVMEPNSGCWIWLQSDRGNGYPQGSAQSITGERVSYAHRLAYLSRHGSIPDGYDVDHLCRNKLCVNPDHLEAVTPHANRSRQFGIPAPAGTSIDTGCPKPGHGQYTMSGSKVVCRQCARERNRRYAARR